jgi:hypothetical protein
MNEYSDLNVNGMLTAKLFLEILPNINDHIFVSEKLAIVFGRSFVVSGSMIYNVTDFLTLRPIGTIKDMGICVMKVLISTSYRSLTDLNRNYFDTRFKAAIKTLLNVPADIVKTVIEQNRIDTSRLDNEPLNIHFKNGFWSLEQNKFCERTNSLEHLVTKFINYEFAYPLGAEQTEIDEAAKSVCFLFSSTEAFLYFHYCIGCALMNTPLRNLIVLLGTGRNGKSTFISMLSSVFECYTIALDSEALDFGKICIHLFFIYSN